MAVETDADRAAFVAADEFAVAVAWIHGAGTASLTAIFDDGYQLFGTDMLDGGVEGAVPQIMAVSSAIPAGAAQGDTVAVTVDPLTPTVRDFTVVEIKPDGTGMTVVRLQDA